MEKVEIQGVRKDERSSSIQVNNLLSLCRWSKVTKLNEHILKTKPTSCTLTRKNTVFSNVKCAERERIVKKETVFVAFSSSGRTM